MKLSEWARKHGLNYQTAHKMFKNGTLPVKAEQLQTGTILIYEEQKTNTSGKTVLYARVSSNDQKQDLERQVERLKLFAAAKGFIVTDVITEIGSGLNQNRTRINKLLSDNSINNIVVEHRDRLTRFGFNLIESSLSAYGRTITVMNETEEDMDLVQDFIDVVTSMCARIYGKRSAKNKATQIKGIIEDK